MFLNTKATANRAAERGKKFIADFITQRKDDGYESTASNFIAVFGSQNDALVTSESIQPTWAIFHKFDAALTASKEVKLTSRQLFDCPESVLALLRAPLLKNEKYEEKLSIYFDRETADCLYGGVCTGDPAMQQRKSHVVSVQAYMRER